METRRSHSFGNLLREWRRDRRQSQLQLALEADISSRHLCFLETGRSQPSREMVLRLAERLQVPLRERNALLAAAGYASVFPERPLNDADLVLARKAVEVVLEGHKPYPAFAVDRHWTLVASNEGFTPFLGGVDPSLLRPPINVLRLTLHPKGLGSRLANYSEWRAHVLDKLRHQCLVSGDPVLANLRTELSEYPEPQASENKAAAPTDPAHHRFVVPFQIVADGKVLSFFSTTTMFGTPIDITLAELSIESFYPADALTSEALRQSRA
jgi:transcriptional regulator with XRE-family HTH domain